MKVIEKDKAIEETWKEPSYSDPLNVLTEIRDRLNTLPTIEIVRCRECRHRFVDGENVRFNVCELNHNKVQADDWFCADGERRDENDTRAFGKN